MASKGGKLADLGQIVGDSPVPDAATIQRFLATMKATSEADRAMTDNLLTPPHDAIDKKLRGYEDVCCLRSSSAP